MVFELQVFESQVFELTEQLEQNSFLHVCQNIKLQQLQ